MRRRGLALILVVGVLAVLAVLGSAFAVLSRMERRAAVQRVLGTQAELLARSGIEDALARVGGGQDPSAPWSLYGGENWDASADGKLSSYEAAQQSFRPTAAGTRADIESCPVRHAMRPSWFVRAAGGDPAVRPVDGKERGWSGALGGGTYALRAEAEGLHVNGLDRRVLGILGEAIDREDGSDDGIPADQADGERLADARPASGWRTWAEIRDGALGGSQAKLEALKPYLALEARVDRKVIAPNPDPSKVGQAPTSWSQIKRWRTGTPEPACEPRAPVSLAWARRRRPALLALLAGLKGMYLDGSTVGVGAEDVGTLRSAEIVLDWTLPTDECRETADRILASASDLSTWDRFHAFCDALPFSGTSDLPQAKRDLLKANFNPNSDLNKRNPDPAMARVVDKSDLLVHSTEFNLFPGGGVALSSIGRVLAPGGRALARRSCSARVAPLEAFRLTTQGEFVASDLGDLARAGDESGFRGYGEATYISESRGMGRTYGHRLSGSGYLDGNSEGVSLQTWPEPHPVWTAPATGRPAVYDGRLSLAAVEIPTVVSMLFLARWNDGFGGDPDGSGTSTPNQPVNWETGMSAACPLFGEGTTLPPGILGPDGIYLEGGTYNEFGDIVWSQPRYRALGNVAAFNGTLSFWVKPNWDRSATRGRSFFNASLGGNVGDAKFAVGIPYAPFHGTTPDSFGMYYRSYPLATPGFQERGTTLVAKPGFLPHRWHLLTSYWDMKVNTLDSQILYADRGDGTNTSICTHNVDDTPTFRTAPLNRPSNWLYPGRGQNSLLVGNWSYPDATFDEFVIYDFGAAPAQAQLDSAALALRRFQDGRYYKESDYFGLGAAGNKAGEWFSAPIRLDGARLVGVSWTQIVPRGLRAPAPSGAGTYPEDGDAGPDGRILIELADAAGADYLRDSAGKPLMAFGTESAYTPVGRRISGPFRLHAVFQPNVDDRLNKAILDPLVLDDVTLTYGGTSGPRITAWGDD